MGKLPIGWNFIPWKVQIVLNINKNKIIILILIIPYFGDLIMGACQAVGFKGMVIDGYTRDRDGNIELEFPVYSKGFMPAGPIKKNEGNINTEIMCAGVRVAPGDLVVGDSDGVCVIPKEYIEAVLTEA